MNKKVNCWEILKCGRQQGGANVMQLGVCPVSNEKRLDAVHSGVNAGRACWVVAGSFCNGTEQGTFAQKFHACQECIFYKTVKQDEGYGFKLSATLLGMIK